MRDLRALPFILVVLALAPAAIASYDPHGFERHDDRGDEQVLFYNYPLNVATRCHDAAIDLTWLAARSENGTLRAAFTVADLGSRHVTCAGVSVDRARAVYDVHLRPNGEGAGDRVRLRVVAGADEAPAACGQMTLLDGTTSTVCVGSFRFDAGRFAWTFPLRGEVVVDNGDVRGYDLTGALYDVYATSGSYVERAGAYPAVMDRTIAYTREMSG